MLAELAVPARAAQLHRVPVESVLAERADPRPVRQAAGPVRSPSVAAESLHLRIPARGPALVRQGPRHCRAGPRACLRWNRHRGQDSDPQDRPDPSPPRGPARPRYHRGYLRGPEPARQGPHRPRADPRAARRCHRCQCPDSTRNLRKADRFRSRILRTGPALARPDPHQCLSPGSRYRSLRSLPVSRSTVVYVLPSRRAADQYRRQMRSWPRPRQGPSPKPPRRPRDECSSMSCFSPSLGCGYGFFPGIRRPGRH